MPNRQLLRGVKPVDQAVFLWLSSFADANRICFPSHSALARHSGISLTGIRRLLKRLESKGLIMTKARRSERGGWSSNVYRIRVATPATDLQTASSDRTETSVARAPAGMSGGPEGRVHIHLGAGPPGATNYIHLELKLKNYTSRKRVSRQRTARGIDGILRSAAIRFRHEEGTDGTVPSGETDDETLRPR